MLACGVRCAVHALLPACLLVAVSMPIHACLHARLAACPLHPPPAARRPPQDNEALSAHVSRCMARDDQLEVSLRAAHDRARVAEAQSLDLTKQCEQAAATLGRLIDSNSELMNKINTQSFALTGEML